MGQYHVLVNLDKRQFLNPHGFGDGYKLREFGNSAGGAPMALVYLLAASNGTGGRGGGDYHTESEVIGSWAGDRIAVMGDYAENTDIPAGLDPEPKSIFARCLRAGEPYPDPEYVTPGLPTYRDISADVRKAMAAEGDFVYTVTQQTVDWGEDHRKHTYDYVTRSRPGHGADTMLVPDMVVRG